MLSLVVGTGRCGSTLVQELLCRHPAIGFVSGLDDKLPKLNLAGQVQRARSTGPAAPRPSGMTSLRHSRRLLERGRLRVAPSEAYHLLDRHVLAGFSRPCRDLVAERPDPVRRAAAAGVLRRRGSPRQRAELLLQHVTGWPRTGFLPAAYPDLRVVNVVRDGRAVVNSWLQMGWWDGWRGPENWYLGPLPDDLRAEWEESGRSFQVLAALGWKMLMEAFAQARLRHPAGPVARRALRGPGRGAARAARPGCSTSSGWTGRRPSRRASPGTTARRARRRRTGTNSARRSSPRSNGCWRSRWPSGATRSRRGHVRPPPRPVVAPDRRARPAAGPAHQRRRTP